MTIYTADSLISDIMKNQNKYYCDNLMEANTLIMTEDVAKRLAACFCIDSETVVGSTGRFNGMTYFVVGEDSDMASGIGDFYEVGYMGRIKQ